MTFPAMIRVKQHIEAPRLDDIKSRVHSGIGALNLARTTRAGQRVAVACSSRGIENYAAIVTEVVAGLKNAGLDPFIIPAMGSHGAASAEGQANVLAHYGITEAAVGAPVRSSLEVVDIGRARADVPVFIDKLAHEADHIVLINRIKKHTDFYGDIESGLMKLMGIGLGKLAGATLYHQAMFSYGYLPILRAVGRKVLETGRVLFGVGIVENGLGQTAEIGIMNAADLVEKEKELLILAKKLQLGLPFDEVDVLLVDELGKDISGAGMDTKVIGRIGLPLLSPDPEKPHIKRIIVSDLTDDSDGNATGTGLADFITQRLYDKVDRYATDINNITGISPEMGRMPIVLKNDREALEIAARCAGLIPPQDLKIMRIKNTARLEEVALSTAYQAQIAERPDLEVLAGPRPFKFDAAGYLAPFSIDA